MNQIVQYGWETGQSKPKTPSSEGMVAIDPNTVLVLRVQLARQDEAKARLGEDWIENDLVFTRPDGSPLHPADVADEFARLIALAGCRRSRCTVFGTVRRRWRWRRGWTSR
ncbi:hypothetical protein ACIOD2_13760 [Amycolatopsis sp. NPDC088138]|uniref:hypothetical protein n=1 Tax=Amycolatopsis sp. NPDC088138 TaxID=3363938 RepID=UPI003820AB11